MQEICRNKGTALIWITHDLGVVAELADRIAVMYAGRIVETGTVSEVLDDPRHPYTRGLLDSMPGTAQAGGRLQQINGMAPSLSARPSGCAFRPRCTRAVSACATQTPVFTEEMAREEVARLDAHQESHHQENRRYCCHVPLGAAEVLA